MPLLTPVHSSGGDQEWHELPVSSLLVLTSVLERRSGLVVRRSGLGQDYYKQVQQVRGQDYYYLRAREELWARLPSRIAKAESASK